MTHRILGGDLSFAERGVRELPAACHVARREDGWDGCAHRVVGRDSFAGIGGDTDLVEPKTLNERRAADGNKHQVSLDRLAVAEVNDEMGAEVVDTGALLLEMHRNIPALEGLQ